MMRGGMYELLYGRWLHNMHLNAYVVALKAKKKLLKSNIRNFLYVSSDYVYYRRNNASNTRCLINHLTKVSVKNNDLIMMSCHLTNHWALLVCQLKQHRWEFYDSMKRKRHSKGLESLVSFLKKQLINIQISTTFDFSSSLAG
ncbi:hypothetical protein KSP40_PGU015659 [Platanthera guangdongensis]|uniref:Ubiquitin-like protease family profile domain-containing protein n=1 Tax=Platanthera guangdongensis TaxID=2320717 RepID=A0ABR2LQV6_9ASPA